MKKIYVKAEASIVDMVAEQVICSSDPDRFTTSPSGTATGGFSDAHGDIWDFEDEED